MTCPPEAGQEVTLTSRDGSKGRLMVRAGGSCSLRAPIFIRPSRSGTEIVLQEGRFNLNVWLPLTTPPVDIRYGLPFRSTHSTPTPRRWTRPFAKPETGRRCAPHRRTNAR